MSSGKQGTDDFTPPAPQCRAETSATNHLPHGTTRTNRSALHLPAAWYSRATRHHRDDGTLVPTNERLTTPVDQMPVTASSGLSATAATWSAGQPGPHDRAHTLRRVVQSQVIFVKHHLRLDTRYTPLRVYPMIGVSGVVDQ